MHKISTGLFFCCWFWGSIAQAQNPVFSPKPVSVEWKKCFGGTADDQFPKIISTSDKGFAILFTTSSYNDLAKDNHGGTDFLLMKLDSNGVMKWSKCFGGSYDEKAASVYETRDHGFLMTGSTYSNDGDVKGKNGKVGTAYTSAHPDGWVLKTDLSGKIIWQLCVGREQDDMVSFGVELSPSGFLIGGGREPADTNARYYQPIFFYSFLDANGKLISTHREAKRTGNAQCILKDEQNNFIFGGNVSGTQDGSFILFKTSGDSVIDYRGFVKGIKTSASFFDMAMAGKDKIIFADFQLGSYPGFSQRTFLYSCDTYGNNAKRLDFNFEIDGSAYENDNTILGLASTSHQAVLVAFDAHKTNGSADERYFGKGFMAEIDTAGNIKQLIEFPEIDKYDVSSNKVQIIQLSGGSYMFVGSGKMCSDGDKATEISMIKFRLPE